MEIDLTKPLTFQQDKVSATLGIDVEDWYHVENLRKVCPRELWDDFESHVEHNVDRILEILENANTTATFFILGVVAEKFPATIVKKIAVAGHELACHGYGHEMLNKLSDEQFRQDINRAKSLIEDISGKTVLGYRAPNFSIRESALNILREVGFKYDSSLNPTKFSSRYGKLNPGLLKPAGKIMKFGSLYEIPMSFLNIMGCHLPVSGGGYFRIYPYFFTKLCARLTIIQNGFYNFYMHPWEIDSKIPRVSGLRIDMKFRHYFNTSRGEMRFKKLVKDFEFKPLCSLIAT